MTRLWPEGELIETPVGAQATHSPSQAPRAPAPLCGVFVWRGMVHRITRVCNCWRIDTHWWARPPEALPDAEPGTSSSEEPSSPPAREGADQRSVGEEEGCPAGMDPPSPTLFPRGERRKRASGSESAASSASGISSSLASQDEEEKSVWREYVKVTTDTGLLCLLYRDLHDGGWFLARVYD